MAKLTEEINAARVNLARLERIAATATCRELGCDMQSTGGANCGCEFEVQHHGETIIVSGCCSVPVNKCSRCGDCDYGDNADATETRRSCEERAALSEANAAPVPDDGKTLPPRSSEGRS